MTDSDNTPIGGAIHGLLRGSQEGRFVLSGMKYADLQRLKSADRAGLLELFKGSEYAVLQQVKKGSTDELAALLIEQAQAAQRAMATMGLMFAGMAFVNIFIG